MDPFFASDGLNRMTDWDLFPWLTREKTIKNPACGEMDSCSLALDADSVSTVAVDWDIPTNEKFKLVKKNKKKNSPPTEKGTRADSRHEREYS